MTTISVARVHGQKYERTVEGCSVKAAERSGGCPPLEALAAVVLGLIEVGLKQPR